MTEIRGIMRAAPVIPVLVIDDPVTARPLAETLVAAGLRVLEVTLRTDAALQVVREMAEVDGAIVGTGTVCSTDDMARSIDAGARFAVSPGLTEPLAEAAKEAAFPFLPGVATAGDILRGMDFGLDAFKFFPAEAAGGIAALKALSAPFGGAVFCPTGGVSAQTAPDWLALPQVLCVGGSWVVPRDATLDEIARLARAAALNT